MPTLTHKEFAKVVGLSHGRISELVREGLPKELDGRINPAKAKRWIRDNLDPKRREAAKPGTGGSRLGAIAKARAVKLGQESELLEIELKQARGNAWDRAEVEAAAFGRARFERDAWHGWTARAAVALASELACDPQTTHATLDRLVREHLVELAATPWEIAK